MIGYQKNNNNNDLDNYDAEIVEDIPEQFDVSRYRKSKISSSNGSNVATKPQPSRHRNYQPYESQPDNRQVPHIYPTIPTAPVDYYNSGYDHRYEQDPNLQSLSYRTNKVPTQYDQQQYPGTVGMQPSPVMSYPHVYPTAKPHHHHLPMMTGATVTASPKIQVPQPIYPKHSAYPPSGMDAYGSKTAMPPYQQNSTVFTPHKQEYQESKKKSVRYPDEKTVETTGYDYADPKQSDDSKYPSHSAYSSSRRKLRSEDRSKSGSVNSLDDVDNRRDDKSSSEYYVKDSERSRKAQFDSSGDSDGSALSDDNQKYPSHKADSGYRPSSHTNPELKSSLKTTKKHGVKFDEKLEVYEVKNPHYGVEAKSEKREMKKKKKDRKKEEEIVFTTKNEMKSKIKARNSQIYYYHYENTLLYNTLCYYEENYYRASLTSNIKLQDKTKPKIEDKLRDQFLQSIERENQIVVDIINSVKNEYANKLQQFCILHQCQLENLHNIPGMIQNMHNIASTLNYVQIINFHANKEPESTSSSSTLSKILGHESKSDKSQTNNMQILIKSPIKRKADILPPKHVVAAIDAHVKDVSMDRFKSLTELIYKLKEVCENDLQLVRAIYKYIVSTQLEKLRTIEIGSYIMRNLDVGLESANTVFSRLCSFAGIENRCIRGYWKTIRDEPGEKVEMKCLWNVVNLSVNGWRFIQPASTPVKYFSRPDYKYEETEFYFLSDPDCLFFEFLPIDKNWLFGDASITVKDFEKRPIISPQFRKLNLAIINQSSNLHSHIDKEPFKLTIQFPHEYADTINFKYKLQLQSSNSSKSALSTLADQQNEPYYNKNVISEIISNEDAVVFKIATLPEVGTYTFTVYAEVDENQANSSSPTLAALTISDNMIAICAFKISCSKVLHFETPPNHIHEIHLFGMNNIMKKLGLLCCDFNKGVLGTDREGKVNLVFEMLQPLDLEVYLYSADVSISSKFLELCILKRVVHNFFIVIIYPPHPGLYGLDVHGAPKGTFNSLVHSQLPPIGKYLIKSHHQVRSFTQFPKGDNRDWGPKQRFYDLGLHTVGNIDPYIINEDGKQIEIEIAMLKPLTIWYKFDHDVNGTTKAIDNYCFMNYKTSAKQKSVSFLLRFPQRGFYHLTIMATEIYPSKPDEIVYNYLIRVQDPSNEVERFPIIVNPILWRECTLITPKNYRLNNYDIHFSLIVPNANKVQIATDDFVIDALEPKQIENSWVGLVKLYNQMDAHFVYVEAEFDGKVHKLVRFKGPNYSNKD